MNKKIKQAVIFAGGLGERLKPFTLTNPKPLYPINGRPFIEYLILQLKSFGIENIVILLGYLPDKIIDFLKDGTEYGVKITYRTTPVEYDTQFRLRSAKDILCDGFLMLYCDNICPVNFNKLVNDYFKHNALINLSVYTNKDGYTKNNVLLDEDGKIIVYDKKRTTPNLHGVDIGYAIMSRHVLDYMSENNENFEAVVYPKLVKEGRLFATSTDHRYYSIGSFERIELTEKFLSGKKYIFLDRDGTVNKRPPKAEYVKKIEDFVWLDGAKDALKMLYDAGYGIIFISNQAGISRGAMTADDFEKVQDKMKNDLKEMGVEILASYYCPHGWDSTCECRKPRAGMLYQAQKDYSIDLSKCILIGDDVRDIMTANNADMKGVLVNDEYTLLDAVKDYFSGNIREYIIK